MKLSCNYLRELVDFPFTAKELAEKLTNLGLEVRDIQPLATLEKVVVGKVLTVRHHPNADRLKLVDVDIDRETLTVVCGAPNVSEGQYVPVALEGARLAEGIKVRRAKVRGVLSLGMICSEKELGLGTDHTGILSLPFSLPLGEDFVRALELDDIILDLEITANRGDCLSVIGIAREVSALTGNPLRLPARYPEKKSPVQNSLDIEILDHQLCPYYSARIIRKVKIGPSPPWLWRIIYILGGKSINNVVDVTNFVLWETGQPLHSFDYQRIRGNKIIVRPAERGEKMTTLDGLERELDKRMLLICDRERPVALAGIMGGQETQVDSYTQDILLESAYFNPVSIRQTSRQLGLITEASFRFERAVDPLGVRMALNRAALLIHDLAGGKVEDQLFEDGAPPWRKREIVLRPKRVNSILRTSLEPVEMRSILTRIGFSIKEKEENYQVGVSSFRPDVSREIDLVEEIARYYGYGRIKSTLPFLRQEPRSGSPQETMEEAIRYLLKGWGFYEIIGSGLEEEVIVKKANLPLKTAIRITNPLSSQQEILRVHLFPHLLETLSYNLDRQTNELRIFEIGDVFAQKGDFTETSLLAGLIKEKNFDFFNLKGIMEVLFEALGIKTVEFKDCQNPFLAVGQSSLVKKKKTTLGFLGRINSSVVQNFHLPSPVYIFEFSLESFRLFYTLREQQFRGLPRFPSVHRDLAFIVAKEVSAGEMKKIILQAGGPLLKEIEIFDVYEGKAITRGYKSMAFSLTFRSPERTLRDEEVNEVQGKIISSLKKEAGARLREK